MNQHKITERTTDKLLGGAAPFAPMSPSHVAVSLAPSAKDPLKPEKAAIIGTAPSSRLLAPFGDTSWAIWGSSAGNMGNAGDPTTPGALPRVDAWFEVHSNLLWPEYASYGQPYVKWLNGQNFPLMATDKNLFPRATEFPWRKLVEEFGPYFFTSTFAWMMAYAIHVGVKELGLYGVDMASKDEYILQRPGGHFFILEAQKRGIKVVVPPESDLVQPPPLYGIDSSTPMGRKIAARKQEVQSRIAQANAQVGQLNGQIAYLNGALEDLDYFSNIWGALDVPR